MDEQHVLDLLIKEHYGLITVEEQEELNMMLASHEDARAMREKVRATPKEEALAFMESANPEVAAASNIARYEALQAHKRNSRTRWIAAAAIAGAAVITFLIWPRQQQTSQQLAHTHSGLTLQLADGSTVVLKDSGQQTITSGNTQLSNNNRVLRFDGQQTDANGWNTLTVPAKLDYRVELSDGSIVWLNSTTKMRFPFAFGHTREVYIEGEAYFSIAQDATKPFIVHSGKASVQVLGTEFNVNSYNSNSVTTSLIQGKVAVTVDKKRTILQPGKELIASASGTKVQTFDQQITLGWRQGIHYFEDASMTEIATMIGRYFDVKMVMDSPAAAEQHFRGKMNRYQPLQNFVDQLNMLGNVQLYWKEGVLHCKTV